ncbi:PPOX class F420-dependent oxidoreductase [Micromonospora sp. NPDC049460]|uniref:PPOX class F420-dependent oxidoreductase n=1 Tax=unclassified Micromonospora TaxID=2617518 RepID=UPI0037115CAD
MGSSLETSSFVICPAHLEKMARLFRAPVIASLSAVSPLGQPQSSPMWAKFDDGQVLFSTAANRLKVRYMLINPRVSVLAWDPDIPGSYIEVRGTASISSEGAMELIDELSLAYRSTHWVPQPDETRVTVRVTPTKTFSRA